MIGLTFLVDNISLIAIALAVFMCSMVMFLVVKGVKKKREHRSAHALYIKMVIRLLTPASTRWLELLREPASYRVL